MGNSWDRPLLTEGAVGARVGEAYTRLEQRADSSLVFWLSCTWVFLFILVAVAFMGAALFHLAKAFTGWVLFAGSS